MYLFCTVTFNINEGTGTTPAAQTASEGSSIPLPNGSGFSRSGYTFVGWNTEDDGTGIHYAIDSYTVTGTITLYAKWIEVIVSASGVELVRVPEGDFQMGTATGGNSDERPVHTVTLTGFYMGKYEVTQAQYQAVMESNQAMSSGVGDNYPVYNVTWYDAVEFCNALSENVGLQAVYMISGMTVTANWSAGGYRLPTEAQWEYAAKGGDGSPGNYLYAGSNDPDEVAWYSGNSNSRTHEVGTKAPNGLGLYDMSGNVYEWCWDWYGSYPSTAQSDPQGASSGSNRVLRGGRWAFNAEYVRSTYRDQYYPSYGTSIGFRVVRPE